MRFNVQISPIEYQGHVYHNFVLCEETSSSTPLSFRFEFSFIKPYSNEYYIVKDYLMKYPKVDLVCKEEVEKNTNKVFKNLYIRFSTGEVGIEYRIRYSFFNTKFDFKLLCKLKDTNSFISRKIVDYVKKTEGETIFADNEETKHDEKLVNYVEELDNKKKKEKRSK